jgi:peroxiredoxin
MKKVILTIMAISILVLGGCEKKEPAEGPTGQPGTPPGTAPPGTTPPEVERKAPDFTLKSFDGETFSLSDLKGKIVVLEWFNFECPYVMYHYDEKTTMVDLANKYKDKDVVWLAINSTSHTTPEANKAFAEKHKLPYPILDDRDGKVGKAYGAMTTPHMFVIDARGSIAYQGAIDNSPRGKKKTGVVNYVEKALDELLAGEEVTKKDTMPYGCSVKYGLPMLVPTQDKKE